MHTQHIHTSLALGASTLSDAFASSWPEKLILENDAPRSVESIIKMLISPLPPSPLPPNPREVYICV